MIITYVGAVALNWLLEAADAVARCEAWVDFYLENTDRWC